MCYYISIGIQQEQYKWAKRLLSDKYDIQETKNPSFCEKLDPKKIAFLLTINGCSCSFYSEIDMEDRLKHERAKLKKKGWSIAKVDRSIEHMIEVTRFGLDRNIIQDMLYLVKNTGSINFAIHWYDGDVDKEQINFLEKKPISTKNLLNEANAIKPDVFYTISL